MALNRNIDGAQKRQYSATNNPAWRYRLGLSDSLTRIFAAVALQIFALYSPGSDSSRPLVHPPDTDHFGGAFWKR